MTDVVPFGKYRGKPVEALAEDRQYCEWLVGQEWFRSRYTAIHTLIINNFGTAAETPEHNALQARFTDKEWAGRFAVAAYGGTAILEKEYAEAVTAAQARTPGQYYYDSPVLTEEEARQLPRPKISTSVRFEETGADVEVSASYRCSFGKKHWIGVYMSPSRVECKPSLGDDYPAVLRQMKANRCNVLLLGDGGYVGTGATLDQVTEIFGQSWIKIVHLRDV